jgi:hypothetical protein
MSAAGPSQDANCLRWRGDALPAQRASLGEVT